MKKTLALLLTIIILIIATGCGNTPTDTSTDNKSSADNNSDSMKVDENLLTMDITLPASFFEDQSEEEIKEKAFENGCTKCKINEDGSVVYTMTKKAHRDMLKELSDEFDKTVLDLVEGENKVESFVSIDYDDNYSKFDVYVDSAKYTSLDNMYALGFYIVGAYYQAFAGIDSDKIDVQVNFIDNQTKEVLDTASYKEYMENSN